METILDVLQVQPIGFGNQEMKLRVMLQEWFSIWLQDMREIMGKSQI
jgi:hypothetical protein